MFNALNFAGITMETPQDLSLSKRDDDEGDVAMNGENSAPQVWSLTIGVKDYL